MLNVYYENILIGGIITNQPLGVAEALNLLDFEEFDFCNEYSFDELDYNQFKLKYQEEKKVTKSLAELLKEEYMERYGLQANQIKLELAIATEDKELGEKILREQDAYSTDKVKLYLESAHKCGNAYGTDINNTWVHLKKEW